MKSVHQIQSLNVKHVENLSLQLRPSMGAVILAMLPSASHVLNSLHQLALNASLATHLTPLSVGVCLPAKYQNAKSVLQVLNRFLAQSARKDT